MKNIEVLDVRGLKYGFSTRRFGNMSLNHGDKGEVEGNRRRFLDSVGINRGDVVFMKPVHGNNVDIVSSVDKITPMEVRTPADGLITTEKGLALGLNAADCTPLIFLDVNKEVLALVHAGRSGTELRIASKTVSLLGQMGFSADRLVVGIGPAIERACYELDWLDTANPDGWEKWVMSADPTKRLVAKPVDGRRTRFEVSGSKLLVDIVGYNKAQLIDSGVRPDNIEGGDVCALHLAREGKLFSHLLTRTYANSPRAHEFPEGRFMTVAQL